jgi:glutathione transport system substrate-binding protein
MFRTFASLLLTAAVVLGLPARALAKDLVVALPADVLGLDPADLNDNISQSATRLMFDGLYRLDHDMKLVPDLATSYDVDEAATEFTFHLRKGVTFQDGTPFNAQAVKFNFDRVGNPANHLKRQSLFSMVAHTDVVDDYTVRVVLKYPFGAFVNDIAHPGAQIVSPKSVQQYGKNVARHPSGTGRYELVSWSADTLVMKKNPNYWAGAPKIDTITYRAVPEDGSRMAMLMAGEAQFIFPVPPQLVPTIAHDPRIVVFDKPSIFAQYVALNTMRKPFTDVRVRQALNYAINKDAFIKVVYRGYADPLDSPEPALMDFYKKQGSYSYDPAKAKQLLAEAGYPNGFDETLTGGNSTLTAQGMEFLQQQLGAVGVRVKVEELEAGVLTSKIFNVQKPSDATITMLYVGWSSSTGDADWALRPLFATSAFPPVLFNVAWYSNPIVDKALQDGLATTDPARRATAYATVQEQVWKDAPWIFLAVPHNLAAYAKGLKGAYVRPDAQFDLDPDATLN